MEFNQRVKNLFHLYEKYGHVYLLLVAHATLFLSKFPASKKVKDTNLLIINGIIEAYAGTFHNSLQKTYVDAIKTNTNVLENYLNWEQTSIVEKNLPSLFPIAIIHFSYMPWYKFYLSFKFHKKQSRIEITKKMYQEMKSYSKENIVKKLLK